jgi:gliding motility-associated-like protein
LYGLFEFGNYSTGADGYFWNFGDGNASVNENPTHQYELPGLYEVVLTAENSYGCTSKDTLWIEVIEGIDVPNVFSPNGDGNNDFFYANSIGMTEKSISIFNRWGKEIYYSSKLDFAWDGTNIWSGLPASEGTYFYVIKASSVTREYEYSGALMLHR